MTVFQLILDPEGLVVQIGNHDIPSHDFANTQNTYNSAEQPAISVLCRKKNSLASNLQASLRK